MRRYAFVDSSGNINSICGWGDGRDLPSGYPIPDGCTAITIEDDSIDINYRYDSDSSSFILKPADNTSVVDPPTTQDLQKQVYDLTTLLVQGGVI